MAGKVGLESEVFNLTWEKWNCQERKKYSDFFFIFILSMFFFNILSSFLTIAIWKVVHNLYNLIPSKWSQSIEPFFTQYEII